ncbi:MAG: LysE family translocator [Bacteroidetes bacterium]|nr:LysE family translocator [Bacteroidota bacterium]
MFESLSPYYFKFCTLAIIQIVAIFSPGPDFTLVVRNTSISNKSTGFFTVLGITLGQAIHLIINIFGINIISNVPWILKLISLIGGIYISFLGISSIYNGYKDFKSRKEKFKTNEHLNYISNIKAFKMGLFTNIFNPKAILFFISVFSTIIDKNTPTIVIILYSLEFLFIGFLCFNAIILLFSIPIIRDYFYKNKYYIELISGVIFIVIGIKLLWY